MTRPACRPAVLRVIEQTMNTAPLMTPAVLPRLSISGLATAFDATVFAILRKRANKANGLHKQSQQEKS